MPFIDLPNGKGKLYVPEKSRDAPQKHPCADCFSCLMCSDDRCLRCRGRCGGCKKQESEETETETAKP